MLSYKSKMLVEFYDTDAMGIVWHGNYVKFLERARCEFLDFYAYDYYQMGIDGYSFPVVKLDIKYISPVKFKQQIEVESILLEFESCLKFKYIITECQSAKKVAVASSTQACVRLNGEHLEYETPARMREIFKKALK